MPRILAQLKIWSDLRPLNSSMNKIIESEKLLHMYMDKKLAVTSTNLAGEVWFVNFPTMITKLRFFVYLTLQKAPYQT